MAHDHHGHAHGHGHGHAHGSPASSPQAAFAVGIGLNIAFVLVESGYGIASGSVALIADAAHNLSDVLGLALAWGATRLATSKPTVRRTYGLRKSTVLSALANAVLLLVAIGGVGWEAVGRIRHPGLVQGGTVMIVAAVGIAINGLSALLFARGREHDVNLKGAFLHLAADAAVSVGVVITGFILVRTGWNWLDPVSSLLISTVVLYGTWGLLKESLDLALDAVPQGIDPDAVRAFLTQLPNVQAVHDLHIWAMSSTEAALTVHLLVPSSAYQRSFLRSVEKDLQERFNIKHVTLQLEPPDDTTQCSPCDP